MSNNNSAAGGIDLQILGIGNNGHIGFQRTRFQHLFPYKTGNRSDNSTRIANAYEFANISLVPRPAITMGISSIMKAKRIVLMGVRSNKACSKTAGRNCNRTNSRITVTTAQ